MAYLYTCPSCGATIEVPYEPVATSPPKPKPVKRSKRKRGK